MSDKLIITNRSALVTKYGQSGTVQIEEALDALRAADARRGLTTTVIYLDQAEALARFGAAPVTSADDWQGVKRIIDAIFVTVPPEYLLLLGSHDVVPYAALRNPVFDPNGDPDEFAPGDLPYACAVPTSTHAADYIGPTRVVGRLPDLTAAKDPGYLVGLIKRRTTPDKTDAGLDVAAKRYFGLTAEVWRESTAESLTALFGDSEFLSVAPPKGPFFAAELLKRPVHFVNCHGAPVDPQFYGQHADEYPIALRSDLLNGVGAGCVAAFECCYGGELHDPSITQGLMSIANRYLAAGAAGLVASTTIAYGPASGNAQADLLCRYFLQSVLAGASLGRAFLEARQRYVRGCAVLTPIDLKTLAQFVLLGDPSLVPLPQAGKVSAGATRIQRQQRRVRLRSLGITLASSVAVARRPISLPVAPKIDELIKSELRKMHQTLRQTARRTFVVSPPVTGVKGRGLPQRVHVVLTQVSKSTPGPSVAGLIAIESGDTVELQRVYSR